MAVRRSRIGVPRAVPSGHFHVPAQKGPTQVLTPTEAGGGEWRVELDPAVLIPGRPARLALTFTPRHSVAAREVRAALVGTETYRYRRGQTTPGVGVVVAHGQLATNAGAFGGPLAAHPFTADAPDAWLPTVDLPHGRARARFHVILARSWAPDEHYVRDVAVCSTTVI